MLTSYITMADAMLCVCHCHSPGKSHANERAFAIMESKKVIVKMEVWKKDSRRKVVIVDID